LGDIWMRLVGFYAAAGLRANCKIAVTVPETLVLLAEEGFGSRLQITSTQVPGGVAFSVRGLRHLLPAAFGGQRFAAPYGRVVIKDWGRWNLRDRVNSGLYALSNFAGLVYSPPWESLAWYQGYSEVVTIPMLRDISAADFNAMVIADRAEISARVCFAAKRRVGNRFNADIVVFPTGSGRQFVPIQWAQSHLSAAVFALHGKDPDLQAWKASGLMTTTYDTPEDIASLALTAGVAVSTDSFPSHVLQYTSDRVVVLITGTAKSRVVAPGFQGAVVDAAVPCHPCPHLERRGFPKCKAGHEVCLNWDSPIYTARILEAVSRLRTKSE
jgi:hypothetical protein